MFLFVWCPVANIGLSVAAAAAVRALASMLLGFVCCSLLC